MGEGLDLPEDLQNTPIRALGPATRRLLSWYLDPTAEVLTSDGLSKDITGLADLAGFDAIFIRYLETKQNKTGTFLDAWGTRNNATVGNLDSFLKKIERFDCISDIKESILCDVEKWTNKQITGATQGFATFRTETGALTFDNVPSEILQKYTACICCADDDLDLANLIVDKYADDGSNFRFFIPQEDLTGGQYEFEATADVIENRCGGRILVILSESYLTSPACTFATQFTKTLDPDAKGRKIIPIVKDEKVVYPRVLRGITTIKTSRLKHGDSFWRRLTSSLSAVPHHTIGGGHEFTQTDIGYSRDNSSFVDKNIIDFGDTSNLSRDSMSLRSGSFDSSSDFGECEKVENINNRTGFIRQKSGLLFTQAKSSETKYSRRIYRTGSVPDLLENRSMDVQNARHCDTDCMTVTSSSSCHSLVNPQEKSGQRKKGNKSPKEWLLRKFFNTFQINKAKRDRSASGSLVCHSDEDCPKDKNVIHFATTCTQPYKASSEMFDDRPSTVSQKSLKDCNKPCLLPVQPGKQCNKSKEDPVTFSLESEDISQETKLEKSTKENISSKSDIIKISESSQTMQVSHRRLFTMDL